MSISIFDFFSPLPRQGPGNDNLTRSMLGKIILPEADWLAVDIGCGSGAQSAVLAELPLTRIVLTDIHIPFVQSAVKSVRAINPVCSASGVAADMSRPAIREGSIDILLCEGAAYNLGFGRFLETWKPMLRPGGWMLLSDAVWSTDTPPAEARAFWESEYPGIGTVDSFRARAEALGFAVRECVLLPGEAWAEFYRHVGHRLNEVEAELSLTDDGRALRDSVDNEIRICREFGWSYSYAYFLLQVPETTPGFV